MRLRSEADVQQFLEAVEKCGGDVYLKSPEGDIFNLKSSMSRYIAIGRLIEEQGDTALHGHRFVEVAFLIGGEVGHRTPFGLERVRRGDVLVIPEGGLHGYEEAAECELINLLFAPHRLPLQLFDLYTHPGYRRLFMTGAESFERLGFYPRLTLPPGVFRQVHSCLKEIIRIEQGDAPGRRCRMMGYLMVILSLLADLCGGKPEEAPPARGGVDRVVRYLNGNFQRQIRKIRCKRVNDLLSDLFRDIEMSSANCDFHSYTSFFECCLNINPAFRISSSNTRKSEFFQKEGSGSGKSSLQRCAFPISFRIFPVRHKKTPGAI